MEERIEISAGTGTKGDRGHTSAVALLTGFAIGINIVCAQNTTAVNAWAMCAASGIAGYLIGQGLEEARRSFADRRFLAEAIFQTMQMACIVPVSASLIGVTGRGLLPFVLALQIVAAFGFISTAKIASRRRKALAGDAGTRDAR